MILALARLVRLAAAIVAGVIVVGILFYVLAANSHNTIVHDTHTAASTLVGPFKNVFSIKHDAKATLAVNWGLAAVVYVVIGSVIASLIARMAGVGPIRRRA